MAPKISRHLHISTLQKFINRQATETNPATLARLDLLIGVYTRLYA